MSSKNNKGEKAPVNFLPQGMILKPEEIEYEFGGPIGVTAMMLGFPALMYYMWICAPVAAMRRTRSALTLLLDHFLHVLGSADSVLLHAAWCVDGGPAIDSPEKQAVALLL